MKTILHLCDIDASVDAVWDALTTQRGLSGWWSTIVNAPPALIGTVVRFTFRGDFNPEMEIVEADEPVTLVWKCVGGHENWRDSTFTFALEFVEDGQTRLRFRQDYAYELSDDYYGSYNFNWGYYLDSLSEYCQTGKGKPFAAAAAAEPV